jgi:hypothetical protein
MFDLDYIRSQHSELISSKRPREHMGNVDDANALERSSHRQCSSMAKPESLGTILASAPSKGKNLRMANLTESMNPSASVIGGCRKQTLWPVKCAHSPACGARPRRRKRWRQPERHAVMMTQSIHSRAAHMLQRLTPSIRAADY